MNIVIADAGPIIALSRISKLHIFHRLFQQVVITKTVRDEILDNDHHLGKSAIKEAINAGWIQVKAVDLMEWKPVNVGVDAGESSAIFLACQSNEPTLLIIDDQAGRAEACYHHIAIIGTAAAIGIAKEQGIINSARDVLMEMCDAGYYIGASIIKTVLDDIGEQ